MRLDLDIIAESWHRNGVGGAPFRAMLVADDTNGGVKLVIAFEDKACTAVLDWDRLVKYGDIMFGSNSWRGDEYRAALDDLIMLNAE